MGFIQEVEKVMVERKEVNRDIDFILDFFNYAESRPKQDIGLDELEMPEAIDEELISIAMRRGIDSFDDLYWYIISILYPYYPEYFAAEDKRDLVQKAEAAIDLLSDFELAILEAKRRAWGSSNKFGLEYMTCAGNC